MLFWFYIQGPWLVKATSTGGLSSPLSTWKLRKKWSWTRRPVYLTWKHLKYGCPQKSPFKSGMQIWCQLMTFLVSWHSEDIHNLIMNGCASLNLMVVTPIATLTNTSLTLNFTFVGATLFLPLTALLCPWVLTYNVSQTLNFMGPQPHLCPVLVTFHAILLMSWSCILYSGYLTMMLPPYFRTRSTVMCCWSVNCFKNTVSSYMTVLIQPNIPLAGCLLVTCITVIICNVF